MFSSGCHAAEWMRDQSGALHNMISVKIMWATQALLSWPQKNLSQNLKKKKKHNYKLLSRVNPNDLTRKLSIIQYCRVMLTVHGKSETGSSKRGGAPQYVQPFTVTKSSSELLLELTLDDFSRGSAEVPEQ